MCGRFGYVNPDFKTYGISKKPAGFKPVYNGAPSERLPGIFVKDGKKDIDLFRFGLVPFWSKTPTVKFSTINATAERIFESPVYRLPIRKQRLLTPVDFYFEWKGYGDGMKQPYLFRLKSRGSFAFGSVYDIWKDAEGKAFPSFSIVTTEPNEFAAKYHNRMPLILPKESWEKWLSPSLTESEIKQLMIPYPNSANMEAIAVSTLVNSPRNDDERIIKPIGEFVSSPFRM